MTTITKKINADTKHGSTPIEIIVHTGEDKVRGFVDFLRTQGVMGLAVGIVLGGAISVLAKSLIDNLITPPLGLLLGSAQGLKGLSITIGKAADGGQVMLHYGTLLTLCCLHWWYIHFSIFLESKILKKRSSLDYTEHVGNGEYITWS